MLVDAELILVRSLAHLSDWYVPKDGNTYTDGVLSLSFLALKQSDTTKKLLELMRRGWVITGIEPLFTASLRRDDLDKGLYSKLTDIPGYSEDWQYNLERYFKKDKKLRKVSGSHIKETLRKVLGEKITLLDENMKISADVYLNDEDLQSRIDLCILMLCTHRRSLSLGFDGKSFLLFEDVSKEEF